MLVMDIYTKQSVKKNKGDPHIVPYEKAHKIRTRIEKQRNLGTVPHDLDSEWQTDLITIDVPNVDYSTNVVAVVVLLLPTQVTFLQSIG